ncbi:MAG: DUF547 domain-containing protein [Planctomycetota bacterium]
MKIPAFSDRSFVALVAKYADRDGRVDYDGWKKSPEDLAALDDFVTLLANVSPENRPELFPDEGAQRSYWITAYNALVLKGVLDLWPLESVRGVKSSLTSYVIPGKGFFYDRRVVVGGRETNLYSIENDILRRRIRDPRVHFALNCASHSCPALRPSRWSDQELDRAARAFINDSRNVRIASDAVYLSRIFEWYREDFVTWLGRPGAGLLDYLIAYADEPLATDLRRARDARLAVRFLDYDWSLNERKP